MARNRKKYAWCVGSPPPPVDPHSVAKHEMLSAYLRGYVQTLARNIKRDSLKLTLVDGFAGGGIYSRVDGQGIWPGSPLRMLQAMEEVSRSEQERREKPFRLDVRYWFVEKDCNNFEFLQRTLRDFGYAGMIGTEIQLRNAEFEAEIDQIVDDVQSRGRSPRAIFVLDQYGYKSASLTRIRSVLERIPKAEVILTFATDWLLDHVSERSEFQKIIDELGLDWSAEWLVSLKRDHPKDWRAVLQHLLHDRVRQQAGGRYYTPFFVHSAESHRAYWLLHLSRHHRAKDVMTALHWRLGNRFIHYGKAGLDMLGFDPSREDILSSRREFLFDTSAETATSEALYAELPSRLAIYRDGISVDDLFARIANETPATSTQVKQTILALAKDHQIRVYRPDGARCSPKTMIKSDHIIQVERKTIFLPYT